MKSVFCHINFGLESGIILIIFFLFFTSRYGDIMTVYFGSKCTIMLNSYDIIKEAFIKHGHVLSGRPQDLFFIQEITEGLGRHSKEVFHIISSEPISKRVTSKSIYEPSMKSVRMDVIGTSWQSTTRDLSNKLNGL